MYKLPDEEDADDIYGTETDDGDIFIPVFEDRTAAVRYSSVYDLESLRAASPGLLEYDDFEAALPITPGLIFPPSLGLTLPIIPCRYDDFEALGLRPTRLVMLHVKDPRLVPSRAFFDGRPAWQNTSEVHMPAQMALADDYRRLYGRCDDTASL